jgi:hypothetical protein
MKKTVFCGAEERLDDRLRRISPQADAARLKPQKNLLETLDVSFIVAEFHRT